MKFNELYSLVLEMPHVKLSNDMVVDLRFEDIDPEDLQGLRRSILNYVRRFPEPHGVLLDIVKDPVVNRVLQVRFKLSRQQFINLINA